ncbi:MAG: hypothetical protein IPO57_13195 [Rhodocyclales bacterium]|nr:hypothetical protein [Rhodocyclales bacterium]
MSLKRSGSDEQQRVLLVRLAVGGDGPAQLVLEAAAVHQGRQGVMIGLPEQLKGNAMRNGNVLHGEEAHLAAIAVLAGAADVEHVLVVARIPQYHAHRRGGLAAGGLQLFQQYRRTVGGAMQGKASAKARPASSA